MQYAPSEELNVTITVPDQFLIYHHTFHQFYTSAFNWFVKFQGYIELYKIFKLNY